MSRSCESSSATSASSRSAASTGVEPSFSAFALGDPLLERLRRCSTRIAVRKRDGAASGNTSDSLYSAASGRSRRDSRSIATSTTVADPLMQHPPGDEERERARRHGEPGLLAKCTNSTDPAIGTRKTKTRISAA